MLHNLKVRLYDILIDIDDNELIDRIVAAILMILILLNITIVVLETVASIKAVYGGLFRAIEIVSVIIFIIEYLIRVWIITLDPRFSHPFWGRLRYATSAMAIVDLLSIVPTFLPLVFQEDKDLTFVRILRLFRLFQLFKMSRYVKSLNTLDDVIRSKKEELLVTVAMIFILLLMSSSLMYVVEHEAQPDKFPDIPSAMWWGVITLATVGYGDVFPVTALGKILGGFTAFLGIGIFALPTGILANGFAEEIKKQRALTNPDCKCPRCGEALSSYELEQLNEINEAKPAAAERS